MRVRRQSDGSNAPATPVHNSVLFPIVKVIFSQAAISDAVTRIEGSFAALWPRPCAKCLVDYTKKESAAKARKAGRRKLMLWKSKEILMLEDALIKLAKINKRKAKILKYRFLVG